MPSLPDPNGRNWYLRKEDCLQILDCTDHEFTLLTQAVGSIGRSAIFNGKALFREHLASFDASGAHRSHLWAEVERTNCKDFGEEDTSFDSQSIPHKRSSTSKLDNLQELENKKLKRSGASHDSGTDHRPGKRTKSSTQPSNAPPASPRRNDGIVPSCQSGPTAAKSEKMSNDPPRPSNDESQSRDTSSEQSGSDFIDRMMQLVKQHRDKTSAELEATFEDRVASNVAAERENIAEERETLAEERKALAEERILVEKERREQKLRSSIMGKAEAQVAAERKQNEVVIERAVQARVGEEKVKWEEEVERQLLKLF
ncbi:hypothetical protein BST61_g9590 [Cercospora zeina]